MRVWIRSAYFTLSLPLVLFGSESALELFTTDTLTRAHDNKNVNNLRVLHTLDTQNLFVQHNTVIGNNLTIHGSFSGTGSIHGPSSSTPHSVARFTDATGSALTDSPLSITDAGDISGITTLTATVINADLNGTASAASFVGGYPATTIAAATSLLQSATSFNNNNTLILRDNTGSFITTMITITGAVYNPTDAATQEYVMTLTAADFLVKKPVNAARSVNLASLSGSMVIDGITVNPGDRVLLVAQTNQLENGIWEVRAGAWTPRPSDFVSGTSAEKAYALVLDGDTLGGTSWICTTPDAIIDTDPLSFSLFELQGQTTGINIGSGTGTIFREKIGNEFHLKTLAAGDHLIVTNNLSGTDITLSITAYTEPEANTLVLRDSLKNVQANIVTASLTGTASDNILRFGDSMIGTFTLNTGSAITPSLQFKASNNTGLSASTPNKLTISTNGITRITLSPTGTVALNSFATASIVHNDSSGNLTSSRINNSAFDADAAIADTKLAPISSPGMVLDSATSATSESLIDTIVLRDDTGNFSANIITASFIDGVITDYVARAGDTMTGTFTVIAGAASNPSLQFVNSNQTGLSATADTLAFSTNASERLSITATGTVTVTNTLMLAPASTTPSLFFSDNSGTGIASPTLDTLALYANTAESMQITPTTITISSACILKNTMSLIRTQSLHITSYGTFPVVIDDTTSLLIIRYITGGPITVDVTFPSHPREGQLVTIKAILEPIPPDTSNNLNLTYNYIFEPATEEVAFLNPTLAINNEFLPPQRGIGGAAVTYIYHTTTYGFPQDGWYRYQRG